MIMKLKIHLVLACFIFFSCASIEREKYFKASGKTLNPSASRFPDSKVAVAEDFYMSIENHALITYAGGPFIPFIPVYLFKDMRRDINQNEDLAITFTRTKYLGPFTNHFEGVKINPPNIQIPGGKLLRPKETVVTNHEVKFIYPIKALVAKEFIVLESGFVLSEGQTIMSPRVWFKFTSDLHYKCCGNFAP